MRRSRSREEELGPSPFRNITEAIYAWEDGQIDLRQPIDIRLERYDEESTSGYGFATYDNRITTTVNRACSANV